MDTVEASTCFIIMPFTDPAGYEPGHFQRVYDGIIKPACERVGLVSVKANDVRAANYIPVEIFAWLYRSPMAICDLSSGNPNVLYELAVRQMLDKPTVLIQEAGDKRIFDIDQFRCLEYPRIRTSEQEEECRNRIAQAIKETQSAAARGEVLNSLARLLGVLSPEEVDRLQYHLVKLEESNQRLAEQNRLRPHQIALEIQESFKRTLDREISRPRSVAGVWKGIVGDKSGNYEETISIRQDGEIVFLDGIACTEDGELIYRWTGQGQLTGDVLVFEWNIKKSGAHGINIMTVSSQGTRLVGKYYNDSGPSRYETYELIPKPGE